MAHTRSQDLEARFNTLQSNFTETQQEVKHLSANVVTINTTMQSSIAASIKEIKEYMTTHLEYVILMLYTKLHIPIDNPLSDPPPHTC
jgi:wobble nucleotide-excising tRNase